MDEDEEDYVLYGTPLPEIEDEYTLRKKAGKELQVRDEKGRQRFHGAFTGGFSAGFFNTVGTKEGWAPSTFISSRSKVSDRIQQNPEDFMDDEDFGVFGIATRKIHTTSNFQDVSVVPAQKRKYVDTDNIIPGEAPLKDIVQPVRESIGMLILKKLGWRPGQGIGPRIKKDSGTKIYGCAPLPDSMSIIEENDPMSMAFTFAPEDTEGMSYHSKDNYFGLGYTGLSKQSVLSAAVDSFTPVSTKSWLAKDKRKLKISGQAFGVGAFEDEDEDIYGKDDMSQYDFSDLALIGLKDCNKALDRQKPGNSQGILVGFCLASQPPFVKKQYPPPALPPNFKPVHQKSLAISQNVNPTMSSSRHALSATDRSLLLGEKKFQKVSLNEVPSIKSPSPNLKLPHNLSSSPATSANFRVFPNDIAKQQRYEEYLKLKEKGDLKNFVQPLSMTEWEKQQELEEFAKASILYKPLSSALSSRFESRSHLSVEHEVMAALEKIKKEKEEKPVVTKKNVVGTSNRKTFEWHPLPLLCKRMNVPNPYPNSDSKGTQSVVKSKSVFQHLTFTTEKATTSKTDFPAPSSSINLEKETEFTSKNSSDNIQTEISVEATPVKSNKNVPPENQKPPMDFFKDIFENSSSEDEDGRENEPQDNLIHSKKETHQQNDKSHDRTEASLENSVSLVTEIIVSNNSNINSSVIEKSLSKKVGFGVFANLDLDALNQRKPTEKTVSSTTETKNDAEEVPISTKIKDDCQNQSGGNDLYGPELPPNFSDISVTEMRATSPMKKTKSKSSHKHKHHKHKHKKKKKKSSKRNSSSDSSGDELDDIPPSLIIEKLKKLQRRKS